MTTQSTDDYADTLSGVERLAYESDIQSAEKWIAVSLSMDVADRVESLKNRDASIRNECAAEIARLEAAAKHAVDYHNITYAILENARGDIAQRDGRIGDLESQLVITARDLAQAREEDAQMCRDRDDALLALGNAALEIERMEQDHTERDELLSKLWDIVRSAGGDTWNGRQLDECVAEIVRERNEAMEQLMDLPSRLGGDSGSVNQWGQLKPTAKEWAHAIYNAAAFLEEHARPTDAERALIEAAVAWQAEQVLAGRLVSWPNDPEIDAVCQAAVAVVRERGIA